MLHLSRRSGRQIALTLFIAVPFLALVAAVPVALAGRRGSTGHVRSQIPEAA